MAILKHKQLAFEYLVEGFIKWFEEVSPGVPFESNFTKLKVIKLHFFASAVNADQQSDGLLNLFDQFYAMPYGHVESNIYDQLGSLTLFNINKYSISKKTSTPSDYYQPIEGLLEELNNALEALKSKNPTLVQSDALELVELSHRWSSWKTIYGLARSLNKYSMRIPKEMIKSEQKVFSLN